MLLANPRADRPKVGPIGEDCQRDNPYSASLDAIGAAEPDPSGSRQAVQVLSKALLGAIVAEEVAEVEGGDALDRHDHFVSPMTTSGITPRTVAGSGSSSCHQICPGTS